MADSKLQGPVTPRTWAERFADTPALRMLLQLIPHVGSVADTAIGAVASRLAAERTAWFFHELSIRGACLTEEIVARDPFVYRFLATKNAALHTHRREKVRALAQLLVNTTVLEPLEEDEFEQVFKTLEGLTHRELCLLALLDAWEANTAEAPPEADAFTRFVEARSTISGNAIPALLARLIASGCVEGAVLTGMGPSGTLSGRALPGVMGRLSPLYRALRRAAVLGEIEIYGTAPSKCSEA